LKTFLDDLAPKTDFLGTVKVLAARLTSLKTEPGKQGEGGFASAVLALRGETKGSLIFEADRVMITLDVQRGLHNQIMVLGQVAADDQDQWTGATVELKQANSSTLLTSLDDLGGFRFENVRPGEMEIAVKSLYNIQLKVPSINIAI
jgi:hypothetical protein